jgi:hypothetical protein
MGLHVAYSRPLQTKSQASKKSSLFSLIACVNEIFAKAHSNSRTDSVTEPSRQRSQPEFDEIEMVYE